MEKYFEVTTNPKKYRKPCGKYKGYYVYVVDRIYNENCIIFSTGAEALDYVVNKAEKRLYSESENNGYRECEELL